MHRDPRAVPVPLSGLAPRLRRIPQHLRPALQVAADVEEHVAVELIGRERHRQLGGADDELATRAHPALGVPPHGVGAADLERLVRGQVPDDVPALRRHLQRGSHSVKLPPGANHDSVEPEHIRGDWHGLLRGEHQERLVLTPALVHEPREDVERGVVWEAAEGERGVVRIVEARLLQVVVRVRPLIRRGEGAGPGRGERPSVLDAGDDLAHVQSLGAVSRRGDVVDVLVVVRGLRLGVDGLQGRAVAVEEDSAGGPVRIADPRVRVRQLDVDVGLTPTGRRGQLHPRGEVLALAEQVSPVVVRVGYERGHAALLQALRADAAAAAESRLLLLRDVHDGVHDRRAVHRVQPLRELHVDVLEPARVGEVRDVLGHAAGERRSGPDVLEMAEYVRRLGLPLARLPGLAVDETDLDVADPRFLHLQLDDAVGGDAHVDELVRDFLVVVPLLHLVHGGDHGVGVEHLANLRLYHALYDGDGQLGRPAEHHGPNHGVRDELELEGHPVAGVHRLRGDRFEQPGAEDPPDVGADVGDGVGEVRADGDDGSRELREVRVLGVEFHGGDEDGPGVVSRGGGVAVARRPGVGDLGDRRAGDERHSRADEPDRPRGSRRRRGARPDAGGGGEARDRGPARGRRRALPDPRELRAEGSHSIPNGVPEGARALRPFVGRALPRSLTRGVHLSSPRARRRAPVLRSSLVTSTRRRC